MRFLSPRQSSALRIAGSGCRPGHPTDGTSQADYSGLNLCFQQCSPKVSEAIGEIGVPSGHLPARALGTLDTLATARFQRCEITRARRRRRGRRRRLRKAAWWDRPAVTMHDSICPGSEDEAAGITERANGSSKIGSREHFITRGQQGIGTPSVRYGDAASPHG